MSSPESSSNWKVTIAVALIGLVGVLGAALIANRPKPGEPPNMPNRNDVAPEIANNSPAPTSPRAATPNDDESASRPTPTPCLIGGRVYNADDPEKGVPNVKVRYYSTTQPDSRTAPTYLVTNKPDGTFKSRCPDMPPASFPLKLELTSPAWPGITVETEDLIPAEGNTDLSFYVSPNEIQQNAASRNPRTIIMAKRAAINPRTQLERRPDQ